MKNLLLFLFLFITIAVDAQTVREIAGLITTPRKVVFLPADYYSLYPGEGEQDAFDQYFSRLMAPQAFRKSDSVGYDTVSRVRYTRNLYGYWRAVIIRTLRFKDSLYDGQVIARTVGTSGEDTLSDMIVSINEERFRIYRKSPGKSKYRVITNSKYSVEAGRYLLLYHNLKEAANASIIGMDKSKRLIINSYMDDKWQDTGNSGVFDVTVNQVLLEKLNVEQLHYKTEKKEFTGPGRHTAPN